MGKIVLDENGNVIDELAIRNEEIKEKIAPVLKEFLDEKKATMMMKKAPKLGYQFTKQIYLALAGYGFMSADRYLELEYDDLYDYWMKYLELTAYYNRYFEIVDNKQLFCAFCGINSRQYSELEKSKDDDIRNLMNAINSSFIGLGFVAGESGNADIKAINTRLRANGEAGHSVISAVEDKALEQGEKQSSNDIMKQLALITGNKFDGLPSGE